jgi:hypothetical protein
MSDSGAGIKTELFDFPVILHPESSILQQQKNPEAFWPQGWYFSSASRTEP